MENNETDKQIAGLQKFCDLVKGIKSHKINKGWGYSVGWSVDGSGDIVQFDEPDEEELRSYLLDVRKLVLGRSPYKIETIRNIVRKVLTDDIVIKQVDAIGRNYKEMFREPLRWFRNRTGRVDLQPSQIVDIYLNAEYFHDDVEKKMKLDKLRSEHPIEIRTLFHSGIRAIVYNADQLAQLIRKHILKEV